MKLAKYLADYIYHHDDEVHDFLDNAEEIIQQGIEAFASTEQGVIIRVDSGVASLVSSPEGIRVMVHDYDVEGIDMSGTDDNFGEDEYGDWYAKGEL